MPAAGQAQPDAMPLLRMRLDDVVVLEPGLGSSSVVTAGTPVSIRLDVGFDGMLAGLVSGQELNVFHHIQNVETGTNTTINGGSFIVPPPAASSHIVHTSGPYATGGGTDFEIPAGFDSGTYRILTHIHPDNASVASIISAFHDGLVVQVIPGP